MEVTVALVLMFCAMVCVVLSAFSVNPPKLSLVPLGLFFWSLAVTLRHLQ